MESWGAPKTQQHYESIRPKYPSDEGVLKLYSNEEQQEIVKKQEILSVLAYFIGRDLKMPVLLNNPGAGWHWNFQENHVKVDPKDLLEKPMDYLRFVICHEGGHRRISRTDFIPKEILNQTGFLYMMNAIEDPRMNNFVADAYSAFERYMEFAYKYLLELDDKIRETAKEKLGYKPKHMQAGWEYIRLWFHDRKKESVEISDQLPDDVREVVQKTLDSAKDSWWTYPSKDQADKSEEEITRFAEASYQINLEKVWPEFKKLVEEDKKTQEMEDLLNDMKGGKGGDMSEEIKSRLSPEEQEALETAVNDAIEKESSKNESSKQGTFVPVDIESLPQSVKQKIRDYIESLPEEKRKALQERAEKELAEFSKEIAKSVQGQFEKDKEAESDKDAQPENIEDIERCDEAEISEEEERKNRDELRKAIEEFKKKSEKVLEKDRTHYESALEDVVPIINKLENDLRQIFLERRNSHWETGYKTGKKIDIKKRIQEKAKGVSVFESRAWQKRELPKEKDYAISLLVDLSGSMRGEKIEETFKAVVVLAEVLNRLSIKTEILGFNNILHEYQTFGEKMSDEIRGKIGIMTKEVHSDRSRYNDDGWALQEASNRLDKEKDIDQRILIVLSDGRPEPSHSHAGSEFNLDTVVKKVIAKHNQRLIGLGIGRGTEHVSHFYPQSIANINVQEMAESLADLIKEVIEHPERS